MCLTALHEHVHARAAFTFAALVSAQAAFSLVSQERGVEPLPPPPEPPPVVLPFDPSQSAGLFVGIRNFSPTSTLSNLSFAADDAVDLAFLFACELHLVEPRQVTLLLSGESQKEESRKRLETLVNLGARKLDANGSTILKALEEQANRAGPAGLLIFTFSSHGMEDRIMAADFSEQEPASTSIDTTTLFARLDQAKSPRKIVLLDVCREAPQAGARDPVGNRRHIVSEPLIRAIAESEGEVILLAARRGNLAFEDPDLKNGVFTGAVVDGLRCKARHNENGHVTVDLLADYVDQQVISWVDKKRPQYRKNSGIERRTNGSAKHMTLSQCPSPCEAVSPLLFVHTGQHTRIVSPEKPMSLTGMEVKSLQNLLIRAEFPEPAPHPECICRWEREQDREQYAGSKETAKVWKPLEGADGLCTFSHPPPNPHESVVLRLTVGKTVHPPFTIEVH